MNAARRSLRAVAFVRHCSASAAKPSAGAATNNKPITGAIGSRGTRGSGKSLIGSAARGVGGGDKLEAMKSGEYGLGQSGEFGLGQSSPDAGTDDYLEGADVLMEVLAEDHRASKMVEFVDPEMLSRSKAVAADDASRSNADVKPFSNFAQRKYLSHRGVSGATVFARAREAGQNRADRAMEAAFVHRLPPEAKKQREHELRSRARQRDHDVIETRIQEAMASGTFDDLPGRGKPLSYEENVWESMAGEAMAHRILKNAGCAPAWVETNKEIRTSLLRARADLEHNWGL